MRTSKQLVLLMILLSSPVYAELHAVAGNGVVAPDNSISGMVFTRLSSGGMHSGEQFDGVVNTSSVVMGSSEIPPVVSQLARMPAITLPLLSGVGAAPSRDPVQVAPVPAVPEPEVWGLLALGLGSLLLRQRSKRR